MVDMVDELDGKVAIVTGSARNIGRATAEELARAGAALVINSVQAKDLCEEVVEGIRAAGGKAIPFMADVRDPDAVNAMAAAANKEFGGIDIMVHNAAVRNNTSFEDMDLETFSTTVDISIYGMFHLAKAALPSMKERGGAAIWCGGYDLDARRRNTFRTMAAKMGLNAFVRGLALDLAPYGIWPTKLWSEPTIRFGRTIPRPRRQRPRPQRQGYSAGPYGHAAGHGRPHPLPRRPGASYITGQTIHSNGGAFLNL